MSSKKGRRCNNWIGTPMKCFMKCLIQCIGERYYESLLGKERNKSIIARWDYLVPYCQDYFEYELTEASVLGRAMTLLASHHKDREDASISPRTAPYYGLARFYERRGEPWDKKKLEEKVAEITKSLSNTVSPSPEKSRRKNPSRETIKLHLEVIESYYNCCCPLCKKSRIVENGERTPLCEIDHHQSVSYANYKATWPLCVSCHDKIEKSEERLKAYEDFKLYQYNVDNYLTFKKEKGELICT